MENLKRDIKSLIDSVKKIKLNESEQKVNDMIEKVKTGVSLESRLSKMKKVEAIQQDISKVAQKKEEIVSKLERRRAILGKNMLLTEEQRRRKAEFLKEEKEGLRKRIESVSKTIENFENKHGKDSKAADYVVLKDNRDKWEKEYEIYDLELESIEIPNPQVVHDKIKEIIDDVIYLNQENVDITRLKEFIDDLDETKEEVENNQENEGKYQAVDMNIDVNRDKGIAYQREEESQEEYVKNIFEEEKTKVEIKRIEISAKDNYAYLVEKNENDKWNLSKIIKTKDVVMNDITAKAKQLGFTNLDIIKIKRRSSPVVGYILNYIKDEDVLRKYLLGIVVDKKVPFKLRYDLNNSSLDKKTFRRLNRYAKKEAKLQGVVVQGAKYNIFEKIKLRFNSNRALGDGKTYTNIKDTQSEDKGRRSKFIESIKVKMDEKNAKLKETAEKEQSYISKANETKQENMPKIDRENMMAQAIKNNGGVSFKAEERDHSKMDKERKDNLMVQALKRDNNRDNSFKAEIKEDVKTDRMREDNLMNQAMEKDDEDER